MDENTMITYFISIPFRYFILGNLYIIVLFSP